MPGHGNHDCTPEHLEVERVIAAEHSRKNDRPIERRVGLIVQHPLRCNHHHGKSREVMNRYEASAAVERAREAHKRVRPGDRL